MPGSQAKAAPPAHALRRSRRVVILAANSLPPWGRARHCRLTRPRRLVSPARMERFKLSTASSRRIGLGFAITLGTIGVCAAGCGTLLGLESE